MREIDINHVMSQLGIQPIQWQELQDQQNQQNEVNAQALSTLRLKHPNHITTPTPSSFT